MKLNAAQSTWSPGSEANYYMQPHITNPNTTGCLIWMHRTTSTLLRHFPKITPTCCLSRERENSNWLRCWAVANRGTNMDPAGKLELEVVTLNIWGLLLISKRRRDRVRCDWGATTPSNECWGNGTVLSGQNPFSS